MIRDIYELRSEYYRKRPNGHYFDYETLKFFGESLSTMYLYKNTVQVKDISGEIHTCYKISKRGKDWRGNRRTTYAYFDVETLDNVIL